MHLETLDWIFIIGYFLAVIAVGLLVAKVAGKDSGQFFLGGRQMPWWLLGFSMVATTFSTDTPNLVTDIVRQNGVAGNWVWWAFLITGMVTVFLFAKLWRRSEVLTDIEFYELRYSGKSAAFLRGFRAIYLGVFFNVMIMASVSLAAIKIGGVMLGLSPTQSILWAGLATVIFSSVGGFRGVVFTDCLLFVIAMVGSVAAAYFAIGHTDIGSLSALLEHPNVADKLSFLPPTGGEAAASEQNLNLWMTLIIIPLVVQWWSVWYPGAEPGGGGYIAQRMLSAKNENHAVGATLFFNVAHYALRPWPWIIIALASLVMFPELSDIQSAFPHVDAANLGHDHAYPAMLTYLPAGLLGLVVASLVAAFMSTISTHLNWGSSYVVNDFYVRFVKKDATDKQQVNVARVSTAVLMVLAALLSLKIESAKEGFDLLLQIGAGTGLIYIMRWFWWRINAYTEIAGMVVSFLVAIGLKLIDHNLEGYQELILGVSITTASWILVTLFPKPTDKKPLVDFYTIIRPSGKSWEKAVGSEVYNSVTERGSLPLQILAMFLACLMVYAALFGTGYILYGQMGNGAMLLSVAAMLAVALGVLWKKGLAGKS